ncbi:hypothetical protein NKH18_04095 [Streptomyces sp. M10(2022)]
MVTALIVLVVWLPGFLIRPAAGGGRKGRRLPAAELPSSRTGDPGGSPGSPVCGPGTHHPHPCPGPFTARSAGNPSAAFPRTLLGSTLGRT